MPSVLWRCWLGGRKGIRPVKNEWWGAGMVMCLEGDADLHMAQVMPMPLIVSCFSKIQIGFTFLIPAHLGSPGKRAVKQECVCVSLVKLWLVWHCCIVCIKCTMNWWANWGKQHWWLLPWNHRSKGMEHHFSTRCILVTKTSSCIEL